MNKPIRRGVFGGIMAASMAPVLLLGGVTPAHAATQVDSSTSVVVSGNGVLGNGCAVRYVKKGNRETLSFIITPGHTHKGVARWTMYTSAGVERYQSWARSHTHPVKKRVVRKVTGSIGVTPCKVWPRP